MQGTRLYPWFSLWLSLWLAALLGCNAQVTADLSGVNANAPAADAGVADEAEGVDDGGSDQTDRNSGSSPHAPAPTPTPATTPGARPTTASPPPAPTSPSPSPVTDLTPPTAALTNAPTGTGHFVSVNVTVGGTEVVFYKYKYASAATVDCGADSGYSASAPVATPVTIDLAANNDDTYTLCVIGADNAGNWQTAANATTATWILDKTPPAAATTLTATAAYKGINLAWTASTASDAVGYLIVLQSDTATLWQPTDGVPAGVGTTGSVTVISVGATTGYAANNLAFDTTYQVGVYAYDGAYNYAVAATASAVASRWRPLSTNGALSPRKMVAYAWTGNTGDAGTSNRLIVWGGQTADANFYADGAIYNPADDTWAPMNGVGAPSGRQFQDGTRLAFWTGATGHTATAHRFIVWGGKNASGFLNSGAVYDPASDSWTPMNATGAPSGRDLFASIWTGDTGDAATRDRLVVWGGDGAANASPYIYDLRANTWTQGTSTSAPGVVKYTAAAWNGSKMIVWGGFNLTNAGGVYDVKNNQWTATATSGAPAARRWHGALWLDDAGIPAKANKMMIYGGYSSSDLASGGFYDLAGSWTPTATANAPGAGRPVAMQRLGTKVLVLAFQLPSIYDLSNDSWQAGSNLGALGSVRYGAWAWTGSKLVVWGGTDAAVGVGAAYDPHW